MFRLALALGSTVAELQARIGVRELAEWLDYWRLEPWGAEADDIRHGNVAAAVLNQYRRGKPLAGGDDAFKVRFESVADAEERRAAEVVEKGIPIMRELMKRSQKAAADGENGHNTNPSGSRRS